MAYEYEGKLLDYASGSKTYEEYKAMSQELQEVYRKAKAFDEVLELHSQHIDKSSIYGNDLPLSVNKYEYYDDGLFAYEMYTLIKTYLEDE
ncbi:hypothetical protein [Staphylococcus saprophyticus]|uniref:hypothetical protein n=1 Tax=Staphylococcus saprophyticus TaxID=29385 RepID=UPI00297777BC|nr:DUF1024 family protein [Staphylococcus saprophyticus]